MNRYVFNRECGCRRCRCKGLMGPAIMITVGVLFLLDNLGVHGADFGHTWPVILLVIGMVKILQSADTRGEHIGPMPGARPPDAVIPPAAGNTVSPPPPTNEVTHG